MGRVSTSALFTLQYLATLTQRSTCILDNWAIGANHSPRKPRHVGPQHQPHYITLKYRRPFIIHMLPELRAWVWVILYIYV